MAITINDLTSEYSLLFDNESYLDELGNDELRDAIGGASPVAATWGAYLLTTLVIGGAGAGFGALVYHLSH
ncbi:MULTISPECIES: hypothetical protein [unclassified Anabaena]|uniref:hypothetical protein n=1 Tax=unclassified Anabaena TaxID=2619674 RepID=UPI002B20E5D6|nr:hypothetical protein [Anabaena sp. UHCC 0399]MEA5565625.1 hypothetical protein [Anabaena sp. UHCC 0399]